MRRHAVAVSIALMLSLVGATGCGEDEKSSGGGGGDSAAKPADFKKEFATNHAGLEKLGNEIEAALNSDEQESDLEFGNKFEKYATRLDELKSKFAALEPPSNVKTDMETFNTALDQVGQDLRGIVAAAESHDPKKAERSAKQLVLDSQEVDPAAKAIAQKQGIKIKID